jgi:hypothetical protein
VTLKGSVMPVSSMEQVNVLSMTPQSAPLAVSADLQRAWSDECLMAAIIPSLPLPGRGLQ